MTHRLNDGETLDGNPGRMRINGLDIEIKTQREYRVGVCVWDAASDIYMGYG